MNCAFTRGSVKYRPLLKLIKEKSKHILFFHLDIFLLRSVRNYFYIGTGTRSARILKPASLGNICQASGSSLIVIKQALRNIQSAVVNTSLVPGFPSREM